MASGVYDVGAMDILATRFRQTAIPGTAYRLYLFDNGGTNAVETKTHDTYADLTGASAAEATGGGYGEATVAANSTDFDVSAAPAGYGHIQLKDFSFTAVSTSIVGIYYAVLTDANGTENSRRLTCFWDLAGPHTVTAGSTLTIQDAEIRITT
ncbi:MAG TPA: hypothetical protein VJP77_05625 [Planctomycetota bacterium]|nr:hypothetical protein [Planctomycetota bacterium]